MTWQWELVSALLFQRPGVGGNNAIRIYGNNIIDGNFDFFQKWQIWVLSIIVDQILGLSRVGKPIDLAIKLGLYPPKKDFLKISWQFTLILKSIDI